MDPVAGSATAAEGQAQAAQASGQARPAPPEVNPHGLLFSNAEHLSAPARELPSLQPDGASTIATSPHSAYTQSSRLQTELACHRPFATTNPGVDEQQRLDGRTIDRRPIMVPDRAALAVGDLWTLGRH